MPASFNQSNHVIIMPLSPVVLFSLVFLFSWNHAMTRMMNTMNAMSMRMKPFTFVMQANPVIKAIITLFFNDGSCHHVIRNRNPSRNNNASRTSFPMERDSYISVGAEHNNNVPMFSVLSFNSNACMVSIDKSMNAIMIITPNTCGMNIIPLTVQPRLNMFVSSLANHTGIAMSQ